MFSDGGVSAVASTTNYKERRDEPSASTYRNDVRLCHQTTRLHLPSTNARTTVQFVHKNLFSVSLVVRQPAPPRCVESCGRSHHSDFGDMLVELM